MSYARSVRIYREMTWWRLVESNQPWQAYETRAFTESAAETIGNASIAMGWVPRSNTSFTG